MDRFMIGDAHIFAIIFYFRIFKKPLNIFFFTLPYVRDDDDCTG